MQGFYNTESTRQESTVNRGRPAVRFNVTEAGRSLVSSDLGESLGQIAPGFASPPVPAQPGDAARAVPDVDNYELGRRVWVEEVCKEGVIIERGNRSLCGGLPSHCRVAFGNGRRQWFRLADLASIGEVKPVSIPEPVPVAAFGISRRVVRYCVRNHRTLKSNR